MKLIFRIISRLLRFTIASYAREDSQRRNRLEDTTQGHTQIIEVTTKFKELFQAKKR